MAKRVKVVLNEDVLSLGKDGDLVEVAPGYARNFLLPFGKALPVTPAVLKQVEHRRGVETISGHPRDGQGQQQSSFRQRREQEVH